jgi:4-hydroxy-tetrahydrodipicolinate synthase
MFARQLKPQSTGADGMFQGSMVALVTPMRGDGEVDDDALTRLVAFHIDQGSDAIVVAGTTGEASTLDEHEHCGLIARVVELVDGRCPVIAGTGSNSTLEAIELTRCAREAGADGALLVTPYYVKPTQEGMYRHFMAVAEAVDLPQILYNVPGRTGCDLLPETVARLAVVDSIVAIKEATGNLDRGRAILDLCGDSIVLLSGDDATSMELLLLGGKGVISVTANVAPKAMKALCDAAIAGDRAAASAIDQQLSLLHKRLFVESNPIPVKWAVARLGLIGEGIRLPLTWLSPGCHATVEEAMRHAGVI